MRTPLNPPYVVTNTFGVPDVNARFGYHSGIDYGVTEGAQVLAPVSGKLSSVISPTGGNMVVIFDGKYYHRLMHNRSFAKTSGQVAEGDLVAYSGNTGLSTGPHVHWDVNTEGVYPSSFNAFINPETLLKGASMPTAAEVKLQFKTFGVPAPTNQQVDYYTSHDWGTLNGDLLVYVSDRERALKNQTTKQIDDLSNRVKALEAQLSIQSDDTAQLNKLGETLKWFIQRLGLRS